ncbi:MAG: Rne/Rng family ribonuclease [Woeseiaceae bacterium]|nr:Rne/Rng family ribonuclease [Woeseiaceae bacterium]
MKRMLINATQQEELRMAMVDGQRLYDLNIEGPASERKKANIYKGKITRIEPSLEAAFVDYGAERHGFLPLKEISSEYFVKETKQGSKPNIKEVLREGQDIVVQIDKEERGNKGAALTTFVSLAGRFIVLKPNKARSGGVSRRIVGGDRDAARKSLNDVEVPDGMSVILRTAGIDRSAEELAWDLENLLAVWQAILNVVLERPSPFLIYRESNAVVRALRDYLTNEIGEILIDNDETFNEAREFVEQVMPHNIKKLKHYTDPVPLFTRFQIETQIESAFAHDVNLPSGGSIVIDHTEALVSIDINSARATKGGDIEATALNTNLEAAEEIARQLRLRDLGGLVVIDFIDMGPQKNQRAVENKLREAVRQDRARVQIGKISRFGLLEMSRQRLRPSLGESSYHTCPRCSGIGTIRSVESLALAILRIIGEEARKERTAKVIAQLPVEVATFLLNEKRDWVQSLESRNEMQVVLVANSALETPHFDIRRVRDDQTELPENAGASYELVEAEPEAFIPASLEEKPVAEQAAVGKIAPTAPAPARKEPEKKPAESGPGFFAKLFSFFKSDAEPEQKAAKKKPQKGRQSQQRGKGRRGDKRATTGSEKRGEQRSRRSRGRGKPRKKTGSGEAQDNAPKQQAEKQAEKQTRGSDSRDGKSRRSSRNRRSRGGRRRREEADKQQDASRQQSNAQTAAEQQKDASAQEQTASGRQRQDKPRSRKPAEKTDGPPKARTDAERAADKENAEQRAAGKSETQKKPRRPRKPRGEAPVEATKASTDKAPDEKTETRSTNGSGGAPVADPEPKKKPDDAKQEKRDDRPVVAEGTQTQEPSQKAKPEPKPERKPAPESKPEQQAEPKPGPEPKSESRPKQKPEPKPESRPQAKPEPKPEGRLLPWEPQANAGASQAAPDTKPKPDPAPPAAQEVPPPKPDDARPTDS